TLRANADRVAINNHVVAINGNGSGETAVHRVKFGQMRIHICIAQIVNAYNLDTVTIVGLVQRAQHIATNTAISINSYSNSHTYSPVKFYVMSDGNIKVF